MPSAEIITIGTELLLGEILDTNARFLAQCLREAGIDLFHKTTVGDNTGRIAQAIQLAMQRSDIVLTTGGLGPTVDDPTRDAVAQAVGVKTEYHPELWKMIRARFKRFGLTPTENNRRQAYIPQGARPIENPVGTAPIFILEKDSKVIVSLPGVPGEMEYLMTHEVIPYLRSYFDIHDVIKNRILHTVGVGESQIDSQIADLEQLRNPTVGLAAHSGQVDIRITAKAITEAGVDELIKPVELQIRERLAEFIYGVDQESLEAIALKPLVELGWTIAVVEAGLSARLLRRISQIPGPFIGGQVLAKPPQPQELLSLTDVYRQAQKADVGLGVAMHKLVDKFEILMVLITPHEQKQLQRFYGGHPDYAPMWAINQSLDLIRRIPYES